MASSEMSSPDQDVNLRAVESIGSFLDKARERADAGTPLSISIRRLVRLVGAERRGANVVSYIQSELDRRGLVTEPAFTSGWIDNRVSIRLAAPANSMDGAETVTPLQTHSPVALTVSSLASASAGISHVDRNQTLDHARALMLANDYSQIAVVSSGLRSLVGAVSWESMAKAALRNHEFSLSDATIPATAVSLEDNLISLVPTIVEQGFVFVVGSDRALCGIVTTADLGEQFATLAKPFFLLGEAERRLRHIVDGAFDAQELKGIKDPDDPREISSAGDLTLGEIQKLLEPQEHWGRLAWPVERSIFIGALNDVRIIRNEVMHFSPDPLGPEQLEQLSNFIKWLSVHDPR